MFVLHPIPSYFALYFTIDHRRTVPHPHRLRAQRHAPHNNLVKFPAFSDTAARRLRRHAACRRQYHLRVGLFSIFSLLLSQHVEYLSLRIKTLLPDLVRGRQSKPNFPSFHFCVLFIIA